MGGSRKKREDPQRTGPDRDPRGFTSDPRGHTGHGPDDDGIGSGTKDWAERISDALEQSYAVVDEQIRYSQGVAQRMFDRGYGPVDLNSDMMEGSWRMLNGGANMAAIWADAWSRAALTGWAGPWAPGGGQSWYGPGRPGHDGPGHDGPAHDGPAHDGPNHSPWTEEVSSRLWVQVTLNLDPAAAAIATELATAGLHAIDSAAPISDVTFLPASGTDGPRVRIGVPDDQPPGAYYGTAIERSTGRVRGTVTVRVAE